MDGSQPFATHRFLLGRLSRGLIPRSFDDWDWDFGPGNKIQNCQDFEPWRNDTCMKRFFNFFHLSWASSWYSRGLIDSRIWRTSRSLVLRNVLSLRSVVQKIWCLRDEAFGTIVDSWLRFWTVEAFYAPKLKGCTTRSGTKPVIPPRKSLGRTRGTFTIITSLGGRSFSTSSSQITPRWQDPSQIVFKRFYRSQNDSEKL